MTVQCALTLVPPGENFVYEDELFAVLDLETDREILVMDDEVPVVSLDEARIGTLPLDTIVQPCVVNFIIGVFGDDEEED